MGVTNCRVLLLLLLLLLLLIYLLTAVGLSPGGSSTVQYSTVHIYTQTVQYSTVKYGTVHIYTQTVHRTTQLIWEQCWPCPVLASYTLAFALQLRKKHGKPQSG